MEISAFVDVNVNANSQQVTQKGFGIPLIPGAHTHWTDLWRKYTSSAGMLADGFLTTDVEYLIALIFESQEPAPEAWIVGRRTRLPTQKWTGTPVVTNNATYKFELDGVTISFTADGSATAAEIITGVRAALASAAIPGITDSGTTTLGLTGVAGAWHRLKNLTPTLWSFVMDSTDAGVAADLADIYAQNREWYGVVTPFPSAAEAAAIAAWTLANKRMFAFTTMDTPTIRGTTGNIGNTLKVATNDRAFFAYSRDNGNFIAEGAMAAQFPYTPGSTQYAYTNILGVSTESLNETETSNLETNGGNWYLSVGGASIFGPGKVAKGEWIDKVIGLDWLGARMAERQFGTLVSQKGTKIPQTDDGLVTLEGDVRAQVEEGQGTGLIAKSPAPAFVTPKVSAMSGADKTARIARGFTAKFYLAGAVFKTQVNLNVLE